MSATQACVSHERGATPPPARRRARRPGRTALCQVVQDCIESWLALKRAGYPWEQTVPPCVEHHFRTHSRYGVFRDGSAWRDVRTVWSRLHHGGRMSGKGRLPVVQCAAFGRDGRAPDFTKASGIITVLILVVSLTMLNVVF